LVNLQKRLKPKDDVRRLQLTDQYRQLQKSPKNKDLDAWVVSWEKVYKEGVKLSQPIVQKDTAVQDFLRAVFDIAPDFASFWTNTIQSSAEDAKSDLYTIIDRFRVQRQILRANSGRSSSRSAFPTSLQGQQQGQQAPKCICGQRHRFSECIYIDASLAPDGWKEDPAVRKTVNEQLKKPEKKAAIDRALKKNKEWKAKQTTENVEKNEIQHQSFALSVFTTTS
jgi:hypothetical protein